jgi:peptidoglycan endopeptidase LytE
MMTSSIFLGIFSSLPAFAEQLPPSGQVSHPYITDSTSHVLTHSNPIAYHPIKRDASYNVSKAHDASESLGQQISDYAHQFINDPYVWGGMSPAGFDCSGFTKYVFNHFGMALPRTASGQTAQGSYVKESNLQSGDLVFFDTDGSGISHVGIYIGNGQFISAASVNVCVSSLSTGYWASTYVTARHIS